MGKYKLLIFDMDGTILDTLKDLTISTNYALKKSGLNERTQSEVRSFVGNGIKKLIERAVPENTEEETSKKVFSDFNEYYKDHCYDFTKSYDGIEELLKKLKKEGYKTAVLSNKADYAVKELSDKFFGELFDYSAGVKENMKTKPSPDGVIEIMKNFGIPKESTLYIGDSEVDILTAKNAGVDCVSVDWGFKSKKFLEENGANIIVSTADELYEKITEQKIIIREFKSEDIPFMTDIWNEVVKEKNAFPQEDCLSESSALSFFSQQTETKVALNEETGEIKGLYILHPNNIGRCGHIANASFAVSKNSRGRHIGEKLVKDCLNTAKEHGFEILQFNAVVETNFAARRLYERLGFKQLGTIPRGFKVSGREYENICLYYKTLI